MSGELNGTSIGFFDKSTGGRKSNKIRNNIKVEAIVSTFSIKKVWEMSRKSKLIPKNE